MPRDCRSAIRMAWDREGCHRSCPRALCPSAVSRGGCQGLYGRSAGARRDRHAPSSFRSRFSIGGSPLRGRISSDALARRDFARIQIRASASPPLPPLHALPRALLRPVDAPSSRRINGPLRSRTPRGCLPHACRPHSRRASSRAARAHRPAIGEPSSRRQSHAHTPHSFIRPVRGLAAAGGIQVAAWRCHSNAKISRL